MRCESVKKLENLENVTPNERILIDAILKDPESFIAAEAENRFADLCFRADDLPADQQAGLKRRQRPEAAAAGMRCARKPKSRWKALTFRFPRPIRSTKSCFI